jgi:hypothetical protein
MHSPKTSASAHRTTNPVNSGLRATNEIMSYHQPMSLGTMHNTQPCLRRVVPFTRLHVPLSISLHCSVVHLTTM